MSITIILTSKDNGTADWQIYSDADDAIATGNEPDTDNDFGAAFTAALGQARRNFSADTVVNVVADDCDLYCQTLGSF